MYFDWYYLVLVLPAIIFSLWASATVKMRFKKYSTQLSLKGITGAQAAREVLDKNGLQNVGIVKIGGELTDNYDPKSNVIHLSESVYDSTSTAAIGVACHEAGHAIQYASSYFPIKIRAAIVPATNIGSKLSMPLIMLGLILCSFSQHLIIIAYIGVICFAFCALFQLLTLPTEFNASNRAIEAISCCEMLTEDELDGTKKVLGAAALTYVAALAVTIMQLLRLIMIVSKGNGK